MLVLRTELSLTSEDREKIRAEVKKHAGEDCIILDCGLRLEEVRLKKEQPLWKRLPWPFRN